MSPGMNALNLLQTGVLRMPFLFASLNGALLAGEGAYRVCAFALRQIGFEGNGSVSSTLSGFVNEVRPYKLRYDKGTAINDNRSLLIKTIVSCAIGILGTTLMNQFFGVPHPMYNKILTYLGPIRLDSTVHPWVDLVAGRFR